MGKSSAKSIFSIAVGLASAYFSGFGSGLSFLQRAAYGLALGSTVWSALWGKQSQSYSFNAAQNKLGMDQMIPIIYGTRKWSGGLETWQNSNSSTSNMTKDCILCEGEITEALGICANMRPIGSQCIFAISNLAYGDATVNRSNGYLTLYANGVTTKINCQSITSVNADLSNENNCSTLKMSQYIETLGNGWRINYNCGADLSPSDFQGVATTNCYKNPVKLYISTETGSSYTMYNGSSSQVPPTNYVTVGSYKNTAWLRAKLVSSSTLSFVNPNITAVIRGRKIYDTRTGIANYSENPAMCLRDYILNKRFGMGRWISQTNIDEDSFREVADYCDEIVTYSDAYHATITEPRYALNLILAESRKHSDNVQDFLAVFGGFLVFSGDKISLRVEKQDSISFSFNETNIKKDSVKFSYTNLSDCPNRYNITYYDPAQDWTGIKVQVNDTADQLSRGNIINKDVTLQGCTNQRQALSLGNLYKAINRLNGCVVNFSTSVMAMHLQPGDVVNFSYRIISNMPVRILSIAKQKGEYQIQAQQYNNSIYDDALGSEISISNYSTSSNPYINEVPEVTNITVDQNYYIQKDGTNVSTMTINWKDPTYVYYYRTFVYYSIDNGSSYVSLGGTTGESLTLTNALVSHTYIFKIIVENTAQRYSAGGYTGNIVCSGKDTNPSDLENFTVAQDSDYFKFGFTNPTDKDYNHIEIRYGGSGWENAILLGNIISSKDELANSGIDDSTVLFRAKVVDNANNYSTNDSTYQLTVTGINYYKNVILTRDDVVLQDGTLENMVFTPTGIIVKIDSLEYGDITTYGDLPSETYGGSYETDPGFIRYTSPTIDTGKIGKTGINFIFDYGFYDETPEYGSFEDRTYGKYPNDTYGMITVDVNSYIKIRFSNDNITWTDWQIYLAGEYNFRYIQYVLYADYTSTTMRGYINSLKQHYDVPDIRMSETLTISSSGTTVNFMDYGYDFYLKPEQINIIVLDATTNISPTYTDLTATSVTVKLYDNTGTAVNGYVQLTAKGY